MNPEIKTKWVEALRSGKYTQGRQWLRDLDNCYCCLGVLCDVAGEKWELLDANYSVRQCKQTLPDEVGDLTGLLPDQQDELTLMNDGSDVMNVKPHSFAQIADWIEANT